MEALARYVAVRHFFPDSSDFCSIYPQTDLLRRLRNLIKTLKKDDVVAESEEWPGLASLAETLVSSYLDHGDKEVHLHTVIACNSVFHIPSKSSTNGMKTRP